MNLMLSYDLRSKEGGTPHAELYAAALDQCRWADQLMVDGVVDHVSVAMSEHHGSEDGFLPSPIVFAAAVAGGTQRLSISISAVIAPLYHPVRLAEDLAVLDLVSGGRATVVLGAGYRAEEFALFGADIARRGAAVEEAVETLKQAWSGSPLDAGGHQVRVTPRPVQQPRPPIVLGGSSLAAARRAARIADGFLPSTPDLMAAYVEERARLGHETPAGGTGGRAPRIELVVAVADDVDAAWEEVGPYCLHDTNTYASWFEAGGASGPFIACSDVEGLRARGPYVVLTPEECAERVRTQRFLLLKPLVGGRSPEAAWETLHLLEKKVLPAA